VATTSKHVRWPAVQNAKQLGMGVQAGYAVAPWALVVAVSGCSLKIHVLQLVQMHAKEMVGHRCFKHSMHDMWCSLLQRVGTQSGAHSLALLACCHVRSDCCCCYVHLGEHPYYVMPHEPEAVCWCSAMVAVTIWCYYGLKSCLRCCTVSLLMVLAWLCVVLTTRSAQDARSLMLQLPLWQLPLAAVQCSDWQV
jgi:hypothetical protein